MFEEDIDDILALAEAEVDRWPSPRVSAAHVLYVLATAYPDAFGHLFGDAGLADLEATLTGGVSAGTPSDIRALLSAADGVDDAIRRLYALLRLRPGTAEEGPTSVHEEWLLHHIDARFRLYELAPARSTLDELYVLIGALKVVNLEPAYTTMRARLSSTLGQSIESDPSAQGGAVGAS